ncbi:MAG TPA: ribosome maturation factor RimM [Solirubrobacteraceae bacterium]|jgi:16S rRNA processing protein RimM
MSRPVSIGRVGKPHGLDGSFHVAEAKPGLLTLGRIVALAGRRYEIVRRAGAESSPIVRLEDVGDREAAQALKGLELTIEAEELPQLAEGEWWAHELEGCTVHDGERDVGVVKRLLELPSCEVLEVQRSGVGSPGVGAPRGAGGRGESQELLLVPMVRDAVRSVDVQARRIDVNLEFLGEQP